MDNKTSLIIQQPTVKFFSATVLIVIATAACAQDTVWISKTGKTVPVKDTAQQYNIIYRSSADSQRVKVISYAISGTILNETNYYPYTPRPVRQGTYLYYSNGQLEEIKEYANDRINGYHIRFWENCRQKRKDLYENGKLVSGHCYGMNGADTAWFAYEVAASFPGGTDSLRRFISRYFYYPAAASSASIQGQVRVSFIIDEEGELTAIEVVNSVHPLLDNEAVRLVKRMPRWLPGTIDGKKVKTRFVLPVTFRISE